MAATTKFWICGNCGFRNHPRPYPQVDPFACEQCGLKGNAASVDYTPGVTLA